MDSGGFSPQNRLCWGIEPPDSALCLESVQDVQDYVSCHPVVARLLWNRGIRSTEQLDFFLNPELSRLPDPFSILDMRKAVDRVAGALATEPREKIAIYGDYDVDGTCGTSLLLDFFRDLGVDVLSYQPHRFTEGYGVHVAAIERLIDQGAKLVITVDCGITAVEPARVCQSRGVDMVVLDHHKLGAELPEAYAVVDPQRPEDESGLLNLCGAGLAFFFAVALRAKLRESGYFNRSQDLAEPNLMRLLDLVAVSTVADVVDVRGVNRILIHHGLRVMMKNPRAGLRALLEAASVAKPTAMHCGFVLGPRINAAGRLQSARAALELLTSTNLDQARILAQELEGINTARRETQDEVHQQARVEAMAQLADPRWTELAAEIPGAEMGPWPRALVLVAPEGNESWHEGVVGIVASKITEEFGRPAFILATKEGQEGVLKGSVRSIPKIDIMAAVSADVVAKHLLNFGGHAHAGGVTLKRDQLQDFREALNWHMAITTSEEQYRRERHYDAEVALEEINARLMADLAMLEPFGHKFPEPVFKIVNASAAEVRILKEKHLKLRLSARGSAHFDAVWFNVIREDSALISVDQLKAGNPCSLWVSPQWNEWQGVKRLQLQVRHAELC